MEEGFGNFRKIKWEFEFYGKKVFIEGKIFKFVVDF